MRERASSTSRRGLLKGAVAATAAASLVNLATDAAAVTGQADAELLAMGRELEALAAEERAAEENENRLYRIADRLRPAPSAALLAYRHRGQPLFQPSADGYVLNAEVHGYLLGFVPSRGTIGAPDGEYPAPHVAADLTAWKEGGRAACEACGADAAFRELERLASAYTDLGNRIAAMPAATPAGVAVKLQALAHCRGGEAGALGEWIGEVIHGQTFGTDERLVYSVFRDTCALRVVGG